MVSIENFKALFLSWIESVVISILFIVVSESLNNPLSLKSPFPWIWFAPMLIALRYGLWQSMLSMLLLFFSYLYHDQTPIAEITFQLFTLGGFVLTILCAMFQSSWSKKVKHNLEISN